MKIALLLAGVLTASISSTSAQQPSPSKPETPLGRCFQLFGALELSGVAVPSVLDQYHWCQMHEDQFEGTGAGSSSPHKKKAPRKQSMVIGDSLAESVDV
jgi:hypothetical protein